MKINNNLTEYGDIVSLEFKKIIKNAFIIFDVFLLGIIIITIFFSYLYYLIIGYIVSSLVSVFLFYITENRINGSYYEDLKKVTKRIGMTHKITYLLTFLAMFLIFQSIWIILVVTLGLLLVRMAIMMTYLFNKNK